MKIKSVEEVEPVLSRCISVSGDDKLFASGGYNGSSFVSHNSVIQRNIIFGCIMRPEKWRFIGIDLKRVELSQYRAYDDVVLGIATELEDAVICLRFAQETMMKRYKDMEEIQMNNFLDLPDAGQALMVMVDEAGELLDDSGGKALIASTVVRTNKGNKRIEDVERGDIVYDNQNKETIVLNKYKPFKQKRFDLSISKDKTGGSEKFTAGAEHLWVAQFYTPDNVFIKEQTVDTQWLYNFKQEQLKYPQEKRLVVKFKKNNNTKS